MGCDESICTCEEDSSSKEEIKNKYYLPEVEEFYVGFEYEINHRNRDATDNRTWCKEKFRLSQEPVRFIKYLLESEPENIRVKVLDEEDIIYNDLIVKIIPKSSGVFPLVKIYKNYDKKGCVFRGVLRNKSEFERVLYKIKEAPQSRRK